MTMLRTRTTPATEVFDDRQQNAVQAGVRQLARAANAAPYRASFVSQALVFTGGDQKTVYHGLGRTPVRWVLEDVTVGPAAVYRISWDERKAVFAASIATTVVIRLGVD